MRRGDDRGAVLVEMAMVVPVLFLFVFGLVDVGLLVFERTEAVAAARDGARAAIVDIDQADVPASPANNRVRAAAIARLHVASPEVAVRCLDPAGAVIACSTAAAALDRVELTVAWTRTSLTFIGGLIGETQQVSATAAMVVSGRRLPAPTVPVTTSTSTSTTSTSTTSTTLAPTTTTTAPPTSTTSTTPCAVILATVSPATNVLEAGASGHLRTDLTITVQTSGACAAGIRIRLSNIDGPTTVAGIGTGPTFTVIVDRNAYKWPKGTNTLTILNASGTVVIGNATFVVT